MLTYARDRDEGKLRAASSPHGPAGGSPRQLSGRDFPSHEPLMSSTTDPATHARPEAKPRRALVIVNAKSRSGRASLATALERLRAHSIEPVQRDCGTRDELSPLIVEHGREVDLVAVGGGDGTLNAAADGVMQVNRPLGVLPMGTANDLARTLGIPADLDAAVQIIAAGRTRRIDLGLVNGHPFFNVASIGLSAELAQADPRRQAPLRQAGYAVTAMRVLARARLFHATIVSKMESVRVRTLVIAVGNGRFYGGGNVVEKDVPPSTTSVSTSTA